MTFRHAMTFSSSRSQTVTYGRTYARKQTAVRNQPLFPTRQPVCKGNDRALRGGYKAGEFLILLHNFLNNNKLNNNKIPDMGYENKYGYLNKILKTKTEKTDSTDNDDKPPTPPVETLTPTDNTEETPTDNTEETPTVDTNKPEYSIKEDKSTLETVKTIPFGGPWHYAQYYTDENGQQLKIGSSEFTAIMNALKTQMGEVEGDRSKRVLPKEITVNGKTYTLMGAEEREKLGLKGQDGGVDTRYTAISNGSSWSVFEKKDGKTTLVDSGLTKEAAEALKLDLEKKAEAEAAANA